MTVSTQVAVKHTVSIITQWGKEHSAKAQNYFNAISALFTKNEEKVTQLETVSSSNQGIIIAKADEISATAKSIEEKLETVTKEQQEARAQLTSRAKSGKFFFHRFLSVQISPSVRLSVRFRF